MGARCIGIPAIEAPCPLICALAGETAKTHVTTQLRRMIFFEFITLGVSKIKHFRDSEVVTRTIRKGNAVVTFPIAALSGDRRDAALDPPSAIRASAETIFV